MAAPDLSIFANYSDALPSPGLLDRRRSGRPGPTRGEGMGVKEGLSLHYPTLSSFSWEDVALAAQWDREEAWAWL